MKFLPTAAFMEQRIPPSWREALLNAGLTVLVQAALGTVMAINGILLAAIAWWYPVSCATIAGLVVVLLYAFGVISFQFSQGAGSRAGSARDIEVARRKFSRWMPPLATKPLRWWEKAVLVPVVAILFAAAIVFCVLLLPFVLFTCYRDYRFRTAMTAERQGEDIGTFARSFDRRSKNFDPWVVRATWDALMFYTDFPIRASDRIDDLGIDPDDGFLAVIPEIVERSGHVLDGAQPDAHPGRETVGDLVLFVSSLKRVGNTKAGRSD